MSSSISNESTFQRSLHDKKNPYVMISREMAQDKSISPKAKGVWVVVTTNAKRAKLMLLLLNILFMFFFFLFASLFAVMGSPSL
ncbi:MAG: hypothetical protein AABY22_28240, partial [Nanoarchaeota archaeon]